LKILTRLFISLAGLLQPGAPEATFLLHGILVHTFRTDTNPACANSGYGDSQTLIRAHRETQVMRAERRTVFAGYSGLGYKSRKVLDSLFKIGVI